MWNIEIILFYKLSQTIPDSSGVSPGNLHHAQESTTVTPYTAISGRFGPKYISETVFSVPAVEIPVFSPTLSTWLSEHKT